MHFYYTFLIVLFILLQTAKMSSTSRRQAYTGGEKLAVVKYSEAPSNKASSRHIDVSTRRTFACCVSRKRHSADAAYQECKHRVPVCLFGAGSQAAGVDNRSSATRHRRICHQSPSQCQAVSRRDGAVIDI